MPNICPATGDNIVKAKNSNRNRMAAVIVYLMFDVVMLYPLLLVNTGWKIRVYLFFSCVPLIA